MDEILISSIVHLSGTFLILLATIFFDDALRGILKIFTILTFISFFYIISFLAYIYVEGPIAVDFISTSQTFAATIPIIFSLYTKYKNYSLNEKHQADKLADLEKIIGDLNKNNTNLIEINKNQNQEITQLNYSIKDKELNISKLNYKCELDDKFTKKIKNLNYLFEQIILNISNENINECFLVIAKYFNIYKSKFESLNHSTSENLEFEKYQYKFILLRLAVLLEIIILFSQNDTEINDLLDRSPLDKDLRNDLITKWNSMKVLERKIEIVN